MKASKAPGGHPTAERAAEIKPSVLAATLTAFAEKGSDFSMDEVARLAGVSKQAIYRRWRSKIDLVIEAIDGILDEGLAGTGERADDPVAALRELAWRNFGDDQVSANRLSIFLQAESFHDDRLRRRLIEWRGRFVELYRRALLEIDAAGRRRSGEVAVQAELLTEMLNGASSTLALTGMVSPAEQRRCFDQRWEAFRLIAIL